MLAAAAAYEAVLALAWIGPGSEPGKGPPGGSVVFGVALLALAVGFVVCLRRAFGRRSSAESAEPLLAPAAASFAAARFYTYDPYYLPTLRRMSEDGAVRPAWILVLAALAAGAGVLTAVRPRRGLGASSVVLMLAAGTAFWEGTGH